MIRADGPPLPLARQFESWWSQLLSTCPRARVLFRLHSGATAKRSSEIRWFCWFEIINQAYEYSGSVRHIIMHEEEFGQELRNKLRGLIADDVVADLRMELAIAKDVGAHLVKLCYFQEGDAPLLCATSYDHWESVKETLRRITQPNIPIAEKRELLPSVAANADALGIHPLQRDALVEQAAARMAPLYQKMVDDTGGRLEDTMRILRACRIFNFEFVARTPLEALREEIAHVSRIPYCYERLDALERELEVYSQRALAVPADPRPSLWEFWCAAALALPTWWDCAQEIALITPSSCTVERVFSMLTQRFGDQQERALEDYVLTSTMLRYNEIWHNHDVR